VLDWLPQVLVVALYCLSLQAVVPLLVAQLAAALGQLQGRELALYWAAWPV
jgi:hypothetical protein